MHSNSPIIQVNILLLLIFGFTSIAYNQGVTTFNINFSPGTNISAIEIRFDDGKGARQIFPAIRNYRVMVKEKYYTEQGIVSITYPGKDDRVYNRTFFVSSKPASVSFIEGKQEGGHFITNNATEAYSTASGKKLNAKIKNDSDSLIAAMLSMSEPGINTDSLQNRSRYYDSIIMVKEMQFMKHNPGDFFSLWFFKERYIPSYFFYPPDTLKSMYNNWFPEKSRQTRMGREIQQIINGRMAGVYGGPAPVFTAKDIHNKDVSLKRHRGKYVLLTFWASWCMPCIEEVPLLKKIRSENDPSFIEIISISIDTDSLAFNKAREKYEMNWTHIFNNRVVANLYGSTPIPATYLVDREGKIIFSHFMNNPSSLAQLIDECKKALSARQN